MAAYLTIDEILLENKTLKERVKQLEKELRVTQTQRAELKDKLDEIKESVNDRNNEDACEILEFFHSCSSIRRTAWKYGMELEELYEQIPQWEDTWRGLEAASDYDECRKEVIGRQEYDADEERAMTADEIKIRDRTPIKEELECLIADYKDSSLSLYEVADRYNLCIYNLFRLLKENNLIETETDAKGYAGFYTEFMGAGTEWDGKCEIGLL
jgi:septal ring factor EnvC (AmiA/AmiB activator)